MNPYKELLTQYLTEKNNIIENQCNICINNEDLNEVKSWSEDECKQVLLSLSAKNDYTACPWCIKYGHNQKLDTSCDTRCLLCGYGRRHGRCGLQGSTYNLVLRRTTHTAIIKMPEIIKLVDNYGYLTSLRLGNQSVEQDRSNPLDTQIGGDHYKNFAIQPIEYTTKNHLGFIQGDIVKRITRYNQPTGKGRQDLEKIIHEVQILIHLEYSGEVV
jgi:hypothetical protein